MYVCIDGCWISEEPSRVGCCDTFCALEVDDDDDDAFQPSSLSLDGILLQHLSKCGRPIFLFQRFDSVPVGQRKIGYVSNDQREHSYSKMERLDWIG
jgi:hypothetical protein